MVVPEHMVEPVGSLAQNLFINAPTLSQLSAASAAFDCDDELDVHVQFYTKNRAILLKVRETHDVVQAICKDDIPGSGQSIVGF